MVIITARKLFVNFLVTIQHCEKSVIPDYLFGSDVKNLVMIHSGEKGVIPEGLIGNPAFKVMNHSGMTTFFKLFSTSYYGMRSTVVACVQRSLNFPPATAVALMLCGLSRVLNELRFSYDFH